jgi:hypothetical protein
MTGRDGGDRVTLAAGVEFGRDWLTGEVPHMFAAWLQARTTQQQLLIARQIQRAAAALESDPGWGGDECRVVTVTWSETTRYRAALVMPLTASDEQIWAEIATIPEAMRCTEPDRPGDCRILSCDLGDDVGTGVAATGSQWHERWGPIAAGIDPRLTEGPGWPPLAAAIARADASGTDIAAVLPELAAQAPLPDDHPAQELRWRLMYACAPALPVPRACLQDGGGPAAEEADGGHAPEPPPDRPPRASPDRGP